MIEYCGGMRGTVSVRFPLTDLPARRQQHKRQRYEDGNVPRQVPGGITDI